MNTLLVVLSLSICALAQGTDKMGLFDAHGDVGETPQKGSAQFDAATGEYRITGGGANMWLKVDAFHFVWKRMSGDFAIGADVRFVGTGAVAHRKAVLIVRQSLDPNSAYADVALHGDGMTSLQFRRAADAETEEVRSDVKAPLHIRIERRGDQFTVYAGAKASGPVTVSLQDPVYVGLGVCSHDAGILETAVFTDVKLEPPAK